MEQYTVLSNKWITDFENAVAAYATAVYWTDGEPGQRVVAAVTFRDLISEFQIGGKRALEVLETALRNSDVISRNTAARLLVELPDPKALAYLIAYLNQRENPPLEATILRLLGAKPLIVDTLWQSFPNLRSFEQIALLESLLRNPTDVGLEFIMHEIFDGDQSMINNVVVKALARWGRDDLLWRIINSPPSLVDQKLPHWLIVDIRLEAAFYSGLSGDKNAVDFLEAIAQSPDVMQAAQAVLRLAWLASPRAIAPIIALLKGTDLYAIGLALNAASVLSCAALGPTLLELAGRLVPSEPGFGTPPLSDEAIRVLGKLTGQPLPDYIVEYIVGVIPDTFTESALLQAVSYYSEALHKLNPALRYYHAEPITLTHLVNSLVTHHEGQRRAAAHNLQAITSENFGFDPDLDLITNLPAIEAWRERAKRFDPLKPGGWAFAGMPLADPEL